MRVRRFITRAILAGAFGGLAFSCASPAPIPSHRQGLFDRLAATEPRHPDGKRPSAQALAGPSRAPASSAQANSDSPAKAAPIKIPMRWPLASVRVTSPFGQRGREFHEGVDLRAATGTAVFAAHSGVVLYAGDRIRGYGKMIVLKNSTGISTVYAHNSRLLVRPGMWIRQGRKIAISGRTGHVTAPHLHFEIREGVTAVDPTKFLPKAKYAFNDESPPSLRPPRKQRYSRRVAKLQSHPSRPAAVAVSDESPSAAE